MKNISYWLDTEYEAHPPLVGDTTADVVIVGAGITGVSAAYHCAKLGMKTILIEKSTIASGAAGRNGGMIVEGFSVPFVTAVKELGMNAATDAWMKTIETRALVRALIENHKIECGLEQPGSLLVASNADESEFVRQESVARKQAGFSVALIEEGVQLSTSPFGRELYTPGDCAMNPVQFVRGLARAAEEYGAHIYEHSEVIRIDARSVATSKGSITAAKVVLALESESSFRDSDEVVITNEQAIVTEPLSEAQIAGLDWNTGGMFWTLGGGLLQHPKNRQSAIYIR